MTRRPLLSICIPTYNRATFLPECLNSIFTNVDQSLFPSTIEVVIADNASTDSTEEVVRAYQKKFSHIVYFRNEKNIGFDRSFEKLITKSTGIYCLSIGDDDAFLPGTIDHIITELRNNPDIPFFGLNCIGYDHQLKNPLLPHPNLRIVEDETYLSLRDYVKSIKKMTNLVGIFVGLSTQLFKRDDWVNIENKDPYYDTLAIHMYVNLTVHKDRPYKIIALPVIKTRASNIRWDVFAGLETIQGRIKSTLTIASWMKKTFHLQIPKFKMILYFYFREYWFTGKEIIKRELLEIGLGKIISLYRQVRDFRSPH